jgi:hypothetical protein
VILHSGVLSTNSLTHYQWRLNGLAIPGAINETLSLNNLKAAQAGLYSVIVSNFAGVITNASAALEVDVPLHLEERWMANRRFFFEVKGNVDQLFTVQASRDLRTWETLMTDRLTNGSFTFSENAQLFQERFYRVVPSLPLMQQLVPINGSFGFRLSSRVRQPLVVEAATNLSNWKPIYTNSALNSSFEFLDQAVTNYPQRFYRARLLP